MRYTLREVQNQIIRERNKRGLTGRLEDLKRLEKKLLAERK